jgi:tRNA threonylcarbamoyl adenosine modification protein (Sua5/YciO/YrdC/YwlC family)
MKKPERYILSELLLPGTHQPAVAEIVEKINSGALFVYPTETIYGIGGIVTDTVQDRIYRAKKRKPEHPLILIAGSYNAFLDLELVLNDTARRLADALWPGNLTMILRFGNSKETVGVRVSDHPFLQCIANRGVVKPLYSTSANISTGRYVNDPEQIYTIFQDSIDFMIDDGILPQTMPSTIVDVSGDRPIILREGVIGKETIHEILSPESRP